MPSSRPDLLLSELHFVDVLKGNIGSGAASSDAKAGASAELSERLAQYELRLREAISTGFLADPTHRAWDPVSVIKTVSGSLQFRQDESASPTSSEIKTSSHAETAEIDAYISDLNKVVSAALDIAACYTMQQSESLLREALRKQADIEMATKAMSQPPGELVDNHIRLLREYNEVKDVGQQLIGMIADNRGVSIASLYDEEEFGLTAND